jgi:hypothetical protein
MLDPQVTHLLETAVNTSCKLAIMLQFYEHGALTATASQMARRVCRDIWSVEAALDELTEDGILCRRDQHFVCKACTDLKAQLQLLSETYAHPLQRNELQQLLRDLERYAPYRKELPQRFFQSQSIAA